MMKELGFLGAFGKEAIEKISVMRELPASK